MEQNPADMPGEKPTMTQAEILAANAPADATLLDEAARAQNSGAAHADPVLAFMDHMRDRMMKVETALGLAPDMAGKIDGAVSALEAGAAPVLAQLHELRVVMSHALAGVGQAFEGKVALPVPPTGRTDSPHMPPPAA